MIDTALEINAQLPFDYRAYFSTRYVANGEIDGDEIVLLKSSQWLDFVHLRQTCAPNYDLPHEAVVTQLRNWASRCHFKVVGADYDSVALQFSTLPANICAFAEEVYRFCPDSVEQGIGFLEEAQNPALFAEARTLCPEISSETLRLYDEEAEDEQEESAEIEADGEESGTSLEDGIRLLAATMAREKWLFLWWD